MTRPMIALLTLALLLTGCAASGMERTLDRAEDRVEEKLERLEEGLEDSLRTAPDYRETVPPGTEAGTEAAVTEETMLTPQEAEQVALDHTGFTMQQVQRMHTEFEMDDGVPQYDVEFREGGWEYEFEIHAQSGEILSFDKDREYD